jgi:hypothetical protein
MRGPAASALSQRKTRKLTIVRLLQNVVAEDPLDEQLFARVLSMGGDEYRRMVPAGAYPWLARVHVDKTLLSKGEDHREGAEQMPRTAWSCATRTRRHGSTSAR